jgi:hypothetical protein
MKLSVMAEGTRLTIKLPGTDFWVIYQKQFGNPHLVLIESWLDAHVTSPTIAEFRARAFQAAVNKARELGWIA